MDLAEMSVLPVPLCLKGNIYDNWQKFKREFEDFLTSIEFDEKPEKVKAAKLRNVIGDSGREIMSTLGLAESVDYSDMMKTLDNWAETQRNPAYERQKFYNHTQSEDETFENFLNDVKNLSLQCNFGNFAEELLRDKIVTGISNSPLKELFRAKPDISFETAVQMCRTADLSEEQLLKLLALKRGEMQSDVEAHEVSDATALDSNSEDFTKEMIVEESTQDCKDCSGQPTAINGNRSEATIRLIVKNVSKLQDNRDSHSCYVRSLPWRVRILQETKDDVKFIGFFLSCNAESKNESWSCSTTAKFRLLPQKEGVEPFSRKFTHVFTYGNGWKSWGYPRFIQWEDMLNPDKGYIKEDSVILEVHFNADVPIWVDPEKNL